MPKAGQLKRRRVGWGSPAQPIRCLGSSPSRGRGALTGNAFWPIWKTTERSSLHLYADALSSSNSVSCHIGDKAEVWGQYSTTLALARIYELDNMSHGRQVDRSHHDDEIRREASYILPREAYVSAVLGILILSVCLSHACFMKERKNILPIF